MTAGTSGQTAETTTRVVARDGEVRIVSAPVPALRSGEVEVATEHSVISPGTERTIIEATKTEGWLSHEYPAADQNWPQTRSAGAQGPAAAARAVDGLGFARLQRGRAGGRVAGDVTDIAPGDIVASPAASAPSTQPGWWSRQPHRARPAGLGTEKAAFVTLGAIALEALRRGQRTLGETIVVFGCGVLGVLVTQLARAAGLY